MRILKLPCLVAVGLFAVTTPLGAADGPELMPASTQAVATLNVKQLLACPPVASQMPKIREAVGDSPECQFLAATLGFDPLRQVDRVWLAVPDVDDDQDVFAVIQGNFDRARITTLSRKAAKEKKDHFKIQAVGSYELFQIWLPDQQDPIFVCYLDGKNMLVSTKKKHVEDAIAVHSGKKSPALNKTLAGLAKKADARQCLSFAALGGAFKGVGGRGGSIEHVQGSVVISNVVQADFRATTKDAGSAITIADEIRKGMKETLQLVNALAEDPDDQAAFKELAELIKVDARGNTVTISATISASILKKIVGARFDFGDR